MLGVGHAFEKAKAKFVFESSRLNSLDWRYQRAVQNDSNILIPDHADSPLPHQCNNHITTSPTSRTRKSHIHSPRLPRRPLCAPRARALSKSELSRQAADPFWTTVSPNDLVSTWVPKNVAANGDLEPRVTFLALWDCFRCPGRPSRGPGGQPVRGSVASGKVTGCFSRCSSFSLALRLLGRSLEGRLVYVLYWSPLGTSAPFRPSHQPSSTNSKKLTWP